MACNLFPQSRYCVLGSGGTPFEERFKRTKPPEPTWKEHDVVHAYPPESGSCKISLGFPGRKQDRILVKGTLVNGTAREWVSRVVFKNNQSAPISKQHRCLRDHLLPVLGLDVVHYIRQKNHVIVPA